MSNNINIAILATHNAGGIITDWQGNEWTPETNYVLAGNKAIHPQFLRIVSSI